MLNILKKIILIGFTFILAWCWNTQINVSTNNQAEIKTEQQQVVTEKTKKIIALWDSLTAWYQLPPKDSYPAQLSKLLQENGYDIKVVNGGHSGDTSKQLLERLDRSIADAKKGDLVILVIWANDWLQWLNLDNLESNIRLVITSLLEKELTVVLWWMQLPFNQGEEYRTKFSSIFPTIAKEFEIVFIPFFLEWVAAETSLNLSDGIHPNKEWYAIIAQNVLNTLENEWLLE